MLPTWALLCDHSLYDAHFEELVSILLKEHCSYGQQSFRWLQWLTARLYCKQMTITTPTHKALHLWGNTSKHGRLADFTHNRSVVQFISDGIFCLLLLKEVSLLKPQNVLSLRYWRKKKPQSLSASLSLSLQCLTKAGEMHVLHFNTRTALQASP